MSGGGAGGSGDIWVVGMLRVKTSGGVNWVACISPGFETSYGAVQLDTATFVYPK